jgi:transglutaminase-like putative cysteine protease
VKRSDLITLLVLFAMLFAAVGSIVAAEWMPGLGVIAWAAALGLLAGTALAYSSFPSWTAHLTSMVYGLFTLGVIGATHPSVAGETGDWRARAALLFQKIFVWLGEALNNGASSEPVIFILLLSGLFWVLGYTAAWYSFRHRRIWHVILPTGVAMFSDVYYYAGQNPMAPFLLIYLLCAVTLLALSHLAEREAGWLHSQVRFSPTLGRWFVVGSLAIAAIAGLFGWRLGEATTSAAGRNFLEQLNQPYNELLARWNRLFANLNNNISREVDSYASSVTLSGPRNLTAEPIMDVVAPPARYYWRAASYDYYDGLTWRNTVETATNAQPFDVNIPLAGYAERTPVQADFSLYRGTDSIYAPLQPLRASVGAQAIFEQVSNATVNLIQLRLPVPLLDGNRYSAIGSVSIANVEQLRAAPSDYPAWTARYLQLPPQVPARVVDLARNITARAPTMFDKAAAVERWLRDNIAYDEQLPAPPPGVEASDYVLFDVRRAYCNYYATAMVTMLRSLGIPSRVAVGYAQGEMALDPNVPDRALYHVKGDDSHMWVEVFFPGYGWVEFEPTAGQPPIERFEPQAEVTPTPAPTLPPPTLTPQPEETQAAQAATPTPEPQPVQPDAPANPPPATNPGANGLSEALNRLRNSWLPYLLLIPLLIAAALGVLRYLESAGLSKLPAVERAYALITRYAGWLGVGKQRQFTPYEQAEALAQRAPQAQAPVQRITDLYVHKRFAPPKDARGQGNDAEALSAWAHARSYLRRALLQSRFGRK